MAERAGEAARSLAKEVDLIVALVAGSGRNLRALVASVPEIDCLVGGGAVREDCDDPRPRELVRTRAAADSAAGGVIINRAGFWGRTIGFTRLVFSPEGDLIEYARREIELTDAIAEDPVLARDAQRVMDVSRELREEMSPPRSPGRRGARE
jgi:2',3'-cyclic-nucleotide 2'-phosphodiesterase (5'-nucleotidase family)